MARINRQSALALSALLHAAVLGFGYISIGWWGKTNPIDVTPITLLTAAEAAKLVAANRATEPAPALTEDPAPEAPPLPPAPVPAPEPTPAPPPVAAAKALPAPAPKAAEKAPVAATPQTKVAAAKATPMNLDTLAESLAKTSTRAAGAPRSNAARGPARPETDLTDRIAEGLARASIDDALGLMRDKLMRLWNPNCGIDGAPNVTLDVKLNQDGSLAKADLVGYPNPDAIRDPATRAAATRALSAAARGSPYTGLPRESYARWGNVRVVFDGKKACEFG